VSPPNALADLCYASAWQIAAEISTGNLSAREVLQAHLDRLAAVEPQLNFLPVPMFEQACAAALACDESQARGELLGPLHGVPITIKECFHISGSPSSIGVRHLADERFSRDAPLVDALRKAGAVIVGKTNVPQLMTLYETDNPVYGRTNNPWNLERSPGGSSGGDAAAVAAGASALGLASDLGGSVRHPAHSCGVQGFKPTAGQLSMAGSRNAFRGMEAIDIAPGLLARTATDLRLGMEVLWSAARSSGLEPCSNRAVDLRGLRVGYFETDHYFEPSPAVARAVKEAAQMLAARGAIVEPWHPPDVEEAVHLYWRIVSADGAADFVRLLGRSPRDRRVNKLIQLVRLPRFARPLLWHMLSSVGQPGLAELVRFTGAASADEYWQLTTACREYRNRFMEAMDRSGVDVLISPPHGLPAFKHGKSLYLLAAASYCYVINLLGLPAGVVAATRVRVDEETCRQPTNDKVMRTARVIELGSAGLPIGVQVSARPWDDRLVLTVMETLEDSFRANSDFPARPPL